MDTLPSLSTTVELILNSLSLAIIRTPKYCLIAQAYSSMGDPTELGFKYLSPEAIPHLSLRSS